MEWLLLLEYEVVLQLLEGQGEQMKMLEFSEQELIQGGKLAKRILLLSRVYNWLNGATFEERVFTHNEEFVSADPLNIYSTSERLQAIQLAVFAEIDNSSI